MLSQEGAAEFLERYHELLRLVGGRLPARGQALPDPGRRLHRRQAPQSVAIAEELARRLAADEVAVRSCTATWGASDGDLRAGETVRSRRGAAPSAAVVALGGGHGLHAMLRRCARSDADVTAVVTVADDGGSSGRLRRERARPAAAR